MQEEKIPAIRDSKTQLYLNKLHLNAADDPELIRKAYQVTIQWKPVSLLMKAGKVIIAEAERRPSQTNDTSP